jgi:transposase
MIRYVGLDVHKRVVEACAVDEAGKVVFRHRFDLNRNSLEAFAQVRLLPTDRVVLEATTNTWAVVAILKPYVAEVAVSNPLQTKAIAQAKVKTDKVDALVLAQLLRCDFLPRVWEPDETTQEMRRWTSRRASLVSDRITVKNRLHSVLAQRLIVLPAVDLFGTKGRLWLQQLEIDAEGRWLIDSDLGLLAGIEREIVAIDQLLAEKGYADVRVRLLMTLPGVSITVAQGLVAAWGDIDRFRDADHAASYLGLVPSTRQSADRCYHGPITKAGRSLSRWLLVQAAQCVRLHPGPLGCFFRRLAKRKNHNVAVVATARKLAVIAWHMLKGNEPYRYAQPLATETKLSRLRVQATGEVRKTGPKKGTSKPKETGIRRRTTKPLAQVYREEGLPELRSLSGAETRVVKQSGAAGFVQSLADAQVRTQATAAKTSSPKKTATSAT